ncbi:MAG: CDP-alcohol phosphatidyltransferase family protein [Thermoleophilia bacterium]|nr:CDP-alcohol phosphatidyltransferase family protein [Thermoleophilia bacterium]
MTQTRSHPLAWVPNALTVGRLAALPLLALMLWRADGPTDPASAWLFAAVGLTDLLDGYLARRWHAETAFGRVADPFADRMLVAVGLIGLILLDRFPAAGPLVILGRDAITMLAVVALARSGLDLRVDFLGKSSSALVMAATALALVSTADWIDGLFWVAVGLSLVAFGHYAVTASRAWRSSRRRAG